MSSKILEALTDENPDLQKQIGCMTGILQLFDRRHILYGRCIGRHSSKRLLPGHFQLDGSSPSTDLTERVNKDADENQINSIETSRASFSSSSCASSFSSFEYNKKVHSELPPYERTMFLEPSSRNSPKSKLSDVNNISINSCHAPSGHDSIDLRDFVEDCFHREPQAPSVIAIPAEQLVKNVLKHQDSPRPMQLSRSVDGLGSDAISEKPKIPSDLNVPLHVLAKLIGSPCYYEVCKPLRSCDRKDNPSFVSKNAPRFSYDGGKASCASDDSREGCKSTINERERPRLSLDSIEGSRRIRDFDVKSGKSNSVLSLNSEKELFTSKKSLGVVAKLMGLEAMPDSNTSGHEQISRMKSTLGNKKQAIGVENEANSFSSLAKATLESKQSRCSLSPRSSVREPTSPHFRNHDSSMKNNCSLRFLIEALPRRQNGCSYRPQKIDTKSKEDNPRPSTAFSVNREIEKRLKELEFQQSGKDLRALKQILNAMKAKMLLEKKREDQELEKTNDNGDLSGIEQNARKANKPFMRTNQFVSTPIKGFRAAGSFDSAIVIKKPKQFTYRTNGPINSAIPAIRKGPIVDDKRISRNSRNMKGPASKVVSRKPINKNFGSLNKKTNGKNDDGISQKSLLRLAKISSQPDAMAKEGSGECSSNNSGSLSPRLFQKKVDQGKRSRPPIQTLELSKARRYRQRQLPESVSLGGRYLVNPAFPQNVEKSSEFDSQTRKLHYIGDESSMQSDNHINIVSEMDSEATSAVRSSAINFFHLRNSNQSPVKLCGLVSGRVSENSYSNLGKDDFLKDIAIAAPEQPSPVSVLDESFYKDDLTLSPVKKLECHFEDNSGNITSYFSNDKCWNSVDFDDIHSEFCPTMNQRKLEKVDHLLQELRQLNSENGEVSKDHIALLYEHTNPDHRYISEILFASGILLKDLSSLKIQPHPSGHPIDPDLFLVLEQTKISRLGVKSNTLEKLHRKILFDTVNEILIQKLALLGPPDPWLRPWKSMGMIPNGQRLLKELCLEIDLLQPERFLKGSLNLASREYLIPQVESWTYSCKEVSGLVLDVERLIFKDLVGEIVNEVSCPRLRAKPIIRCRQLFFK